MSHATVMYSAYVWVGIFLCLSQSAMISGLNLACFSVSRLQLDTLELMDKTVARWPRELSSPGRFVTPYFIQLSFRDIDQPDKRKFFNRIPTSFSLTDEQVEKLIAAGRELLRSNRDFQRFVAKNR